MYSILFGGGGVLLVVVGDPIIIIVIVVIILFSINTVGVKIIEISFSLFKKKKKEYF